MGRGAGVRGGLGRIAAMVIGLAVVLVLALAGEARAGTYRVVQCGWGAGAELDPSVPAAQGEGFRIADRCEPSPSPAALRLEVRSDDRVVQGLARVIWTAPAGTSVVAARSIWWGDLEPGLHGMLGALEGGAFEPRAEIDGAQPPATVAVSFSRAAPAIEFRLACSPPAPEVTCPVSRPNWSALRELTLTLADPTPPTLTLGGSLASSEWHRGAVEITESAGDVGSGVARLEATLDGSALDSAPLACASTAIGGEVTATALVPCPLGTARTFALETAAVSDGTHQLRACATDFSGNATCSASVPVAIDNSPPTAGFVATAPGGVAVTMNDAFSGPATGSIGMRRAEAPNWVELPTELEREGLGRARLTATLPRLEAGAYFFRADFTDGAGNLGEIRLRVEGSPEAIRARLAGAGGDIAHAPGRRGGRAGGSGDARPTHLTAHLSIGGASPTGRRDAVHPTLTVSFNATPVLRGRLTAASGDGAAGQRIGVRIRPDRGAHQPVSVAHATTGGDGSYALRLPAGGPSRRVEVFFAGVEGLASSESSPLRLRVRSAVDFEATPVSLRTGETVTLRGRVRLGPARIPKRGKLVAIQYLERAGGHWRPALVVHTDPRGRFDIPYRFRYVTGEARIRLRATALPEAGWPYAAGSSPPVTVRVRG